MGNQMREKNTQFIWTDVEILRIIAHSGESAGADIPTVRQSFDLLQKRELSDTELRGGLERLSKAGFIGERGGRYVVTDNARGGLPRTSSGKLSFRTRDWYRLLGVEPVSRRIKVSVELLEGD